MKKLMLAVTTFGFLLLGNLELNASSILQGKRNAALENRMSQQPVHQSIQPVPQPRQIIIPKPARPRSNAFSHPKPTNAKPIEWKKATPHQSSHL